MCIQGKASVDTMNRTFNILLGNSLFNRARFETSVTAIGQAFEDAYAFYSPYIPFNPACCGIKDLGAQADRVTAEMLSSVGAAPIGPGPGSATGFNLEQLMPLAYLAVGAVILSNVTPFLRKR